MDEENKKERKCFGVGCKKTNARLICGRCGVVSYCSRDCQKSHWRAGHKKECKKKTKTIKIGDVQKTLKDVTRAILEKNASKPSMNGWGAGGSDWIKDRLSRFKPTQNFYDIGGVKGDVALNKPKTLEEACKAWANVRETTIGFSFDENTKTLEATLVSRVDGDGDLMKYDPKYYPKRGSKDLLHWHVLVGEATNGSLYRLCYIAKRFLPGLVKDVKVYVRCDACDDDDDDDDNDDPADDGSHDGSHLCGFVSTKIRYHPVGEYDEHEFNTKISVALKKKNGKYVKSKIKDLYEGAHGFMGTPVPGIPGAFYVDGDDDAVFYTDEYFDDEYDDDY